MQSLEISRQEADYMLNDALNKIKRSAAAAAASSNSDSHQMSVQQTHQSLLLNHHQANDFGHHVLHHLTTTTTSASPASTGSASNMPLPETNNNMSLNIGHHVVGDKRSASNDNNSTPVANFSSSSNYSGGNNNSSSSINSAAIKNGSPTKKHKSNNSAGSGNNNNNCNIAFQNSSTLTTTSASSSISAHESATNDGSGPTAESATFFDIHEKLRELYVYLYLKDMQDAQVENRIKLRSRSFVLETLVARENLNTVILNLYPGNKGYSLAFRQEFMPQNKTHDGMHSVFSRSTSKTMGSADMMLNSNNRQHLEKEEHLLETVRWPYEIGDLLESINKEELPILYMKLLVSYAPNAFYSGCVIVEVRDYRQSFPISACCDNYYVLLKPTTQTLLADVKVIAAEEDFSHEDRVLLESNMVLATADPLCLDPSPKVARKAFYSQYKRQMWNSSAIRRQMKKFSQVAINRKRKTDQFTHTYGLELSDFLYRTRQKPRPQPQTIDSSISASSKIPRKAIDVMKPMRTPNLDLPTTLKPPSSVNVEEYAKAYERPRETKDCMPQLIEEYVLETDRGCGRIYHIKLSIYQRPANSEYLGELYVDRDYEKDVRNGEACQFSLGTRAHANRYIQQFTEIFTEEGRKSVKITHIVPGQAPKVSCTTGMVEHRQQQQQQQQQQQKQQLVATLHIPAALNQTQTNQQIAQIPANSATTAIIGIAKLQQAAAANASDTHPVQQHLQHAQQPHLSLANGSLVVVQEQPFGSLSGVSTMTPQQHQQYHQVTAAVANQQQQNQNTISNQAPAQGIQTANSLPLMQAQLQVSPQQQQQLMGKQTSMNPEINALMTSIIHSANQLQQQSGNAQPIKANNNAAIISLLNSAPAAMTSSTVVNNINNTPSSSPMHHSGQSNSSNQSVESTLQQTQAATLLPKTSHMSHATRKTSLQSNQLQTTVAGGQNRLHNQTNLITVNANTALGTGGQMVGIQAAPTTQRCSQTLLSPDAQGNQQLSVRVTMSALASQLASPPAMMSSSINPQNYNFAQLKQTPQPQHQQQQQQIILSGNVASTTNRYQSVRRDSMTAPSPGSDSNASSASSSNLGCNNSFTINPGFPFLGPATSPTTSIISNDGSNCQLSNHSASGLAERLNTNSNSLSHHSPLSTGGGPSPSSSASSTHFMAPSPKSNLSQHMQVQSPASISPLSSPPHQMVQTQQHQQSQPSQTTTMNQTQQSQHGQQQQQQQQQPHVHPQTTTLNLQGINLSSLQGAMATFPGLQNVQVQIPGLAQPISLSLSGAAGAALATANQHQSTTGLLVSVPVTNTSQISQLQAVNSTIPASSVLGQSTQTVVLTTAGQPGQSGSMLSLPIAQLVAASNVKTLNQQHLRGVTNAKSTITGVNVNMGTTIQTQQQQRPRSVPTMATSPISAKQLTARGLITSQRNIVAAPNAQQMKITTPITMASNPTGTNMSGIVNNKNSMVLTAQLHLQKQAQIQQQLQQNIKLSNNQMVAASSLNAMVTSADHLSMPSGSNSTNVVGLDKITNSDGSTVLIGNNANQNSLVNAVAAALQNKNRRRSTPTDFNK